jgi:hypothetical protein
MRPRTARLIVPGWTTKIMVFVTSVRESGLMRLCPSYRLETTVSVIPSARGLKKCRALPGLLLGKQTFNGLVRESDRGMCPSWC